MFSGVNNSGTAGNSGAPQGTGSLFGTGTGGAKPGEGLFGGGTGAAAPTSLFGAPKTDQASKPPVAPTGGLFGSSSGMFTNAATNQPAAGNPPQPTTAITGQVGAPSATNPAAPTTGGMFSAQAGAPKAGSMFGGGSLTQPTTTAPTAGTNPQPTAPGTTAPPTAGVTGTTGTTTTPGPSGLFASGTAAPATTATPGATANPSSLFGGGAATAPKPAGTTGGLMGTTTLGGNPSTTTPQPTPVDPQEALLKNRYLSELMKEWKDSIKNQVEDFQQIAVDIRSNEAELIKNHQYIYNLNQVHQSVQEEHKSIDEYLTKLEVDQDHLERQLTLFVNELEKQNKLLATNEGRATGSLVQKCKELNEKITRVDHELESMITTFNTESHSPDKIDRENVPVNISLLMNHMFTTLSNLEGETMLLTRRLHAVTDQQLHR